SPDAEACFIAWTRENVEELTGQARTAGAMLKAIHDLSEWLNDDPVRRFADLVAAITGDALGAKMALVVAGIEERFAEGDHGTAPYLEVPSDRHATLPAPVASRRRAGTSLHAGGMP